MSALGHVVIGGGRGLLGTALRRALVARGVDVTVVSRTAAAVDGPRTSIISWDELERSGLPQADAVVQLAGENIMRKPWTPAQQMKLIRSRIETTRALQRAMLAAERPPAVYLCSSAVGRYPSNPNAPEGASDDEMITEAADPDELEGRVGFAQSLCAQWEMCVERFQRDQESLPGSTACAVLRTGVVIGKEAEAFKAMALPFRLYAGGMMGSGKQVLSWVHIRDWVGAVLHLLEQNPRDLGPRYNVVAPSRTTNAEFSAALGRVLKRPSWLHVPSLAAQLVLGQRAPLVLEGVWVHPQALLDAGYRFEFPEVDGALEDIVSG